MTVNVKFCVTLASFALAACSDCKDREVLYESLFSSPFYDLTVNQVRNAEGNGFTCPEVPVRDANGVRIGTEWRCTKCE